MMSLGPPAGNGTISLIGFAGKSCAAASAGNNAKENRVASVPGIRIEAVLPGFSRQENVICLKFKQF
jgi:hypothetical protein